MPPRKSQKNHILLLVFIHGFKGGAETFEGFPQHLHALLRNALPSLRILTLNYPTYDTRGHLQECVAAFKEWLQNKVIDLEVANGTSSPTIDPAVRTILVGHSMGGIVAADTVLSILSDKPVPNVETAPNGPNSRSDSPRPAASRQNSSRPGMPQRTASTISTRSTKSTKSTKPASVPGTPTFMFPYIQGVLAFDTPYLGVAPSVVAHGAEGQWSSLSSAYSAYNTVSGLFGVGSHSAEGAVKVNNTNVDASRALPAPAPAGGSTALPSTGSAAVTNPDADAAATPLWQRWGKYAMFAGTAGAVAATGAAAAYWNRDSLTSGWTWALSHLEFVGCLGRAEELQQRVQQIVFTSKERGMGFANFFTALGAGGVVPRPQQDGAMQARGEMGLRTFVVVPKEKSEVRKFWIKCTNERATSEVAAHMNMFSPKENPGYYSLAERAKKTVVAWAGGERIQEAAKSGPAAPAEGLAAS